MATENWITVRLAVRLEADVANSGQKDKHSAVATPWKQGGSRVWCDLANRRLQPLGHLSGVWMSNAYGVMQTAQIVYHWHF